jgi:hypothetical protein
MKADEQITLNAKGVKLSVITLLNDGKVEEALRLFQDNSAKVLPAIKEYEASKHKITERPDKKVKNKEDYKTHKLPISYQKYINEIEKFFLLGQPLKWEMRNPVDEQTALKSTFSLFLDFLRSQHYDTNNSKAKRLAGAETECAKLYAIYKDEGEQKIKTLVLAKSLGYDLRPLFNRMGDMKAFAVGYTLKNAENITYKHWDIYFSEVIYHCDQSWKSEGESDEWIIEKEVNFIGKIPIIYFTQSVAWDGAQERIERLEEMDSKTADIIDYTDNPILILSSKVQNSIAGAKEVGKLLRVNNKDDVVKYLEVPNQNEAKQQERDNLEQSIALTTFTPDFTYKNVKGLGAISGAAISKANILGYLKRTTLMEIYDEMFERDCSVIKAILGNILYPNKKSEIDKMDIHHIYQDPAIGIDDNSEEISRWKEIGAMSTESAVAANRNVQNKELEVERIRQEQAAANIQQQTIDE